jgi:hypothetical protein
MPARKHVAPELIAEGKYLYEQSLMPTDEIGAKMGLSRSAFYLRVKEWNWKRRRYSSGDIDAQQTAAVCAAAASAPVVARRAAQQLPPEPPLAIAERLRRVIDAQLQVAERTLQVLGPASSAEAERTSRILALVSRTVQEIKASAEGQTSTDEANHDSVPRDIDEFRETLALRIRSFVDARQRRAGGGDVVSAGDPEPGGL